MWSNLSAWRWGAQKLARFLLPLPYADSVRLHPNSWRQMLVARINVQPCPDTIIFPKFYLTLVSIVWKNRICSLPWYSKCNTLQYCTSGTCSLRSSLSRATFRQTSAQFQHTKCRLDLKQYCRHYQLNSWLRVGHIQKVSEKRWQSIQLNFANDSMHTILDIFWREWFSILNKQIYTAIGTPSPQLQRCSLHPR